MDYTDFNHRMVYDGKRNNREVEITCEYCGATSWQRWQRAKKKLKDESEFFCSRECHTEYQRENVKHEGIENARLNFDKSRNIWCAYWWEDGVLKNTTGAKWLWEQNYGEVPDGYWVTFKDGNSENCVLENLELISRGERMSEAMMGHELSEETKQKISKAHTGKILSEEHKLNISNSLRKRWRSGEFDNIHLGENSLLWRGGHDKIYADDFTEELRFQIRERDNFSCRICKRPQLDEGKAFSIHHIDANKMNSDPDNLITLCNSCHASIHSNKQDVPIEILAFRSMLKY